MKARSFTSRLTTFLQPKSCFSNIELNVKFFSFFYYLISSILSHDDDDVNKTRFIVTLIFALKHFAVEGCLYLDLN